MRRALALLKPTPHYRREAFEAGFKALGFTLVKRLDDPGPGDALCWGQFHPHEIAGGEPLRRILEC